MRKILTSVICAALSVGPLLSGVANASCLAPPPLPSAIAQAAEVFVGTVVELDNMDRWATVEVETVWKGEEIPAEVEVRAGPKDPPGDLSVASSTDRTFELGKRYLFVPFDRNGSVFRDNACTSTSVFSPQVERLEPASATQPEPSASEEDNFGPPPTREPGEDGWKELPPLVGGAIVLTAVGLVLYRRRASH